MTFIDKLKKRWKIKSTFQVIIIIIVFGITGSSALFVKKIVFEFLGIDSNTSNYIFYPAYILTIIPIYQVLLLFWAFIFRQFDFFWNFQKKSFSRLRRKKKS